MRYPFGVGESLGECLALLLAESSEGWIWKLVICFAQVMKSLSMSHYSNVSRIQLYTRLHLSRWRYVAGILEVWAFVEVVGVSVSVMVSGRL